MKVKVQEYARLLYTLLAEKKDEKIAQIFYDFLYLVDSNGDLSKIENIIGAFEEYYKKAEGLAVVKVVTAYPLDNDIRSMIENYAKNIKPEVERVEIEEVVEPKVFGGIKIMVEDVLFDGTIKKQLINLKNSLIQ